MYFGSVRFFKNLILLVMIILIITPTVFAFHFYFDLQEQKAELAALKKKLPDDFGEEAGDGAENAELPYQSLYPDFYAPEEYHATQNTKGVIYLTFDDGPSHNTDKILKTLAEQDVKATFFVTGKTSEADLERMRDIVAQGHAIGMHSYSHNYNKIYNSVEDFLDDMYLIYNQIKDTTGEAPVLFRFPGGSINSYNGGIYREITAEMIRRGFVPWDWNLSAQDSVTAKITSAQITANIMGQAQHINRGVVLMHDSAAKNATAGSVESVIKGLRAKGFTFDKLTPELKPVLFSYKE